MPANSPPKSAYPGEPTLLLKGGPDATQRGSEQHATALLLIASVTEARQGSATSALDFHQLRHARQSPNAELRSMAETAHQLVDHNLISPTDAAALRIRHIDTRDAKLTEAVAGLTGVAALSAQISNYNPATKGLTVVEQDTLRFFKAHENPEAARAFVFKHELGHALHPREATQDALKGMPQALVPVRANNSPNPEGALYDEMWSDVFALATTAVTHGKSVADKQANLAMVSRETEHGAWLTTASRQPLGAPPFNDHHTTAAILEFKAQLEAGRFSGPQTPESFNQAISEIVAKGLQKELSRAPQNWVGAHQLGPDNQLRPVPPEVRTALIERAQQNAASDYQWDRAHVRLVVAPEIAGQISQPGAPPLHSERLEVNGKSYVVLSTEPPAQLSVPAQGDTPARLLKVEESSLGIIQAAKAQTLIAEKLADRVQENSQAKEPVASTPTAPAAGEPTAPRLVDRER